MDNWKADLGSIGPWPTEWQSLQLASPTLQWPRPNGFRKWTSKAQKKECKLCKELSGLLQSSMESYPLPTSCRRSSLAWRSQCPRTWKSWSQSCPSIGSCWWRNIHLEAWWNPYRLGYPSSRLRLCKLLKRSSSHQKWRQNGTSGFDGPKSVGRRWSQSRRLWKNVGCDRHLSWCHAPAFQHLWCFPCSLWQKLA